MRPHPSTPARRRDGARHPALRLVAWLLALALGSGAAAVGQAPAASAATPPGPISLSVVAGPVSGGTFVAITGTRLTTATKVTFGASVVTRITHRSSTRIEVTTPPHAAGLVPVRVTTADGTTAISSRASFAFEAVPTLTALSVRTGPAGGGTVVTLTGTGLYRASAVRFGATAATGLTRLSATQLRVTTPAHAPGPVDVRVTTPGGVSAVTSAARFVYGSPPTVSALSVQAGPTRGGTVVTITGTQLSGATEVRFGTTLATGLTRVSATTLRVTAPAHAAGSVAVRVTNASGTSTASTRSTFEYLPVPTVTTLSVPAGPLAGGTVVTLTGTGLLRATAVIFGSSAVSSLTRVSDTTLRVTAPAHAAGTVGVRVTTPGGSSAPATGATFTYQPVPVVTGLSPALAPTRGGTVVTITGTAFTRATTVVFGGVPATSVVLVSATQLRVTAPPHAVGVVDVRVTTPGGTSASSGRATFEYLPVPAVTKVTEEAGPLKGGTVVTITGTGLLHATEVTFGSTPGAAVTPVSDTELRVTAPAHAAGTVSVRVTSPGGTSVASAAASFTYQPVPVVTALSPRLVPSRGGTVVTVTGTAFTRVEAVLFGGVPATSVVRVSATQLRVVVPAHAEGVVDVRVTTPGGQSPVSSASRFTYQDPPVITKVSPAAGPLTGGTVVTLTGTSFTDVSGVWFDGVPATAVKRLSATSLVVAAPARSSTGWVSLRVTTPAGTVSRANAFAYQAGSALVVGQSLSSGTALVSPDGAYAATMRADGNLVVSLRGVTRWSSGSTGAGSRAFVRADGNLVVMRPNGTVAWASGTAGFSGSALSLGNDGLLMLRRGTTPVWDHRGMRYDRVLSGQVLRTGESILSLNHAWVLTMRYDGNLMLASTSGKRQWATFTSGTGNTAVVQSDGNVVVRSSRGTALWSTRTAGSGGSHLRLLDNGNLAVYRGTTVAWAITGGPAPSGWACRVYASRSCITSFGYIGQRVWNYPTDAWGNNCTNFAAYRLARDGVRNPGNLGNATTWDTNARAKGFLVDQRPKVGTIAQWNSNHVAYVDWVSADGSLIAISESGYGGTVLGMTFISMSGRRLIARGSSSWPSNFIHFR